MNVQSLLEQLLKSGMSSMGGGQSGSKPASQGQGGDWGKYATGGAVGGALGLLLGSKRGRGMGGKAVKYGSVAAIGALAWKLYQEHQAKQSPATAAEPATARLEALPTPRFDALPAPALEQHSQAMLKAMIAAAKSDGHMDDRERALVETELQRLDADPMLHQWVHDELRRPVEPAEVAAAATSPEMAAEIYLATLLVVDQTTTMERAYLDELSRRLNLAPGLKADLEARAAAA